MTKASITATLLSSINIKELDILNVLKSLDVYKAHRHDDFSIWMLNLCHKSILKPFKLLLENYLRTEIFSDQWKKTDIVPIHKKGDEQRVKNYRSVFLLRIFGKVFYRIIFNDLFKDFKENNLFSLRQSGVIRGALSVQQLIVITHEIYKVLDCSPSLEVRGVFLDDSKNLGKVA